MDFLPYPVDFQPGRRLSGGSRKKGSVMPTYLALGDSMSIDDYTGVPGGGAVHQFFSRLRDGWTLDDRTFDGCVMADVPRTGRGELITLTAGGNDLLLNADKFLREGLREFENEHFELLADIRRTNPTAAFIVGDVYAPAADLNSMQAQRLHEANAIIRKNCSRHNALLAPIHATFRGHEQSYLCFAIEPNLLGARKIADLFEKAMRGAEVADRQGKPGS
jgi:hypothetical protein